MVLTGETKPVLIKRMTGENDREKKGVVWEGKGKEVGEYVAYRTSRNKYTLYRVCSNRKA